MFCSNCGNQLRDGAAFCSNCGMQVSAQQGYAQQQSNAQQGYAQQQLNAQQGYAQQQPNVQQAPMKSKPPKKKKRGLAVALIALLLIAITGGVVSALYFTGDDYNIKKNMRLAEESYEEEAYEDALKYYEKALKLDETLLDAYLMSADIHLMNEDFKDAIKILEQGIKKNKKADELAEKLVDVYEDVADYYVAKEDYEKAVDYLKEGFEATGDESLSDMEQEITDEYLIPEEVNPAIPEPVQPEPVVPEPVQPEPVQPEPKQSNPVTLVYAEVNPLDSVAGQMAVDFKNKVEELSGGNITIDLCHSGVCGSEADVLDSMLAGVEVIDMARVSAFALTSHGGDSSKLLSLPYTFSSRDHFWNFANSDLAEQFLVEPSLNGAGIRGLFYGEEGFRHFFSTPPINSIEDLAGKNIRVSADPVMYGLVNGLGANDIQVSFTELYYGFQTGIVDVAEQPIVNYKVNAFNAVAPHMILDGHTIGATQVIITDSAWNSLTEEQQAWIKEAGEYASNNCRMNSETKEQEVMDELLNDGVTFVEVTDITPWREACSAVIEENIAGYEELYQQILALE